jgi:FKBP-type peptidyl-prolyl cis-trans isomerase
MKSKITVILTMAFMVALVGCDQMSFKKTKSGLVYKIISGKGKDSLIKSGNVVKFQFIRKLNDSVLYSSYGKMPGFSQMNMTPDLNYSPMEVFFMLRKGDSAVTVELYDSLSKKGLATQLPPTAKSGDKINTYIKILEIYTSDSLAMADFNEEMAKDKPRQDKEAMEMQIKGELERVAASKKELEEMRASGIVDKGIKEMESFLAAKKITAQRTNDGTFVVINQKGTGEPVIDGKFVDVKYTGKILETDSVFQSSQYKFKLGTAGVVRGWDDGLKLFNVGGKGTLYIPGYMAYGKNPGPGNKEFQALVFDVEIISVSNTESEPVVEIPEPTDIKGKRAKKQ